MRNIYLIFLIFSTLNADQIKSGASFKEGKGLEIAEITKSSLGIKLSEFNEDTGLIPKSAVLLTIEGKFVYVVNGKHFIRTPIETTDSESDYVKVTSGLYAGDEVVTSSVNYLWYAELEAIRGGVSCADGH